jgi:hypothetical protein
MPPKSQLGSRQILTNNSEKNMNMVMNMVKSPSQQNVESPPPQLTKENVNRLDTNSDRRNSNSSVGSEAYSVNSGIQYSKGSRLSTASSSEPNSRQSSEPSSEPNSRQSSEPSSEPNSRESLVPRVITPEPIPNSNTVYESIQKKFNDNIQQYTENISKVDPKPITESTRDSLQNNYLFVFLGDNLINFFESTSNFDLGATFSYSNQKYLPNNYISKKNDFKSIFQISKDKFITVHEVTDTNEYTGIGSFSPIITNTDIIEFYVYDLNSVLKETYYTYGNIFIYEHGIASTCEIVKAEQIPTIKSTILPHDTQVNANLKYEPENPTIKDLISKIKSDVFGTATTLTKKQIIIHYLNAISLEDLKIIIPDLKAVAQVLFVNISCPTNGDVSIYNFLHKYVNYYYVYKSEKNTARKIDEYINVETQYSPFAMHIFDFFEFLMFLKGKESTNTNLINCCIQIYNIYIANYTEGFTNLSDNKLIQNIQDAMKKKQKKIHTYLQIIQETTTPKYEIKLNKKIGVTGDTDINNDKSMMLTYKTKTGSNNKPILEPQIYKFGPFDKIYESGNKYEEIADDPYFNKIITKINSDSPMMISFHGPIGSARTKMSRKMIVSICNKLATKGYVNLDIEFQEFFRKHDGNENEEGVKNKISLKSSDSVFKIITQTDKIPEPYHSTKTSKIIKINDSLDKLLEYYFDTDRITKRFSTYMDNANSFDSPRSHVLCFCKMTKNGNDPNPLYIIFDDLAGNETKYNCTNEDFLKKIKGFKVKKDSKEFFYENEFDVNGENFDFYKGGDSTKDKMQKSKDLYNKLIRKACDNRSIEGDFINKSLKEFRADLEYMVDVKNRDNKYYVPDIYGEQIDGVSIKTCLQDFCFGKTGCFQLKDVKDVKEPQSIILKSVYDYLNQKLKIESVTNFYDKLEVCIFGVFNNNNTDKPTSHHLNEPPNYIDINDVKSIIYGKDEFTFNNNPGVFEAFKTALESSATYTSRLSVLYARFPEKYVNELLTKCNNVFSSNVRGQNAITTLTLAQIETFKAVFDAIDDENAKTAIGTLEFMNKISKFNVVNSICYKKNDGTNYV